MCTSTQQQVHLLFLPAGPTTEQGQQEKVSNDYLKEVLWDFAHYQTGRLIQRCINIWCGFLCDLKQLQQWDFYLTDALWWKGSVEGKIDARKHRRISMLDKMALFSYTWLPKINSVLCIKLPLSFLRKKESDKINWMISDSWLSTL